MHVKNDPWLDHDRKPLDFGLTLDAEPKLLNKSFGGAKPDTYSVDEIDLHVGGQKIEPYRGPDAFDANGTPIDFKTVKVFTDTAHGHTQTEIREITDAEARALGLATDEAAKVHIDELMALLGNELCAIIGERPSRLPKHVQMIAARVALEQGLDPVQCLNDLDRTLERMGTDSAFGDSIRALGRRLGAPASLQGHMGAMNRKARRAAKAQARGRK